MKDFFEFAPKLIAWQQRHGRHDLPWQNTRDPYRVWLSEIMLQQTQVVTVIPYYQRFLARFPDIAALAAAPVDEVMALWSGLGYYARARNLHRCAEVLVCEHGGEFPREPASIAALPGIGRSTAAAIAAFSFGVRAPILDGNVKRVLTRHFGIAGFPGEKKIEARLWRLAAALLPERDIESYTQAQMDLGATLCTRGTPQCARCPLRESCVAHRDHRVAELPTPRPKRTLPKKSATLLVLRDGERVLLERRPPVGIWGGLLSLPALPEGEVDVMEYAAQRLGCVVGAVDKLTPLRHGFTHFHLELKPLVCDVVKHRPAAHQDHYLWLDAAELDAAPLPAPIRKLLRRLNEPQLL